MSLGEQMGAASVWLERPLHERLAYLVKGLRSGECSPAIAADILENIAEEEEIAFSRGDSW